VHHWQAVGFAIQLDDVDDAPTVFARKASLPHHLTCARVVERLREISARRRQECRTPARLDRRRGHIAFAQRREQQAFGDGALSVATVPTGTI
jgi:hypothetical protein